MRLKLNIILSLSLPFLAASCSILDREATIIVADTFYNSETEVLYGLAGVYGALNSEDLYGNNYSLKISNVDDLCYYNRSSSSSSTQTYSHDASCTEVYETWTKLYAGIGNANSFMEAVEDSEYDPDHKYYNEARFLRAYYHFLLAEAWGDVPEMSWKKTLAVAVPLWIVGYALTAGWFWMTMPRDFPVEGPVSIAVKMETSWQFCSTGVAMTSVAYFMLIRKLTCSGSFYRKVVLPGAGISYGVYLMHMFVLVFFHQTVTAWGLGTPLHIFVTAVLTFFSCFILARVLSLVPGSRYLLG